MRDVVISALAGTVAPAPVVVPDPPVRSALIRRFLEYMNYSEHIQPSVFLLLAKKFVKLSTF